MTMINNRATMSQGQEQMLLNVKTIVTRYDESTSNLAYNFCLVETKSSIPCVRRQTLRWDFHFIVVKFLHLLYTDGTNEA